MSEEKHIPPISSSKVSPAKKSKSNIKATSSEEKDFGKSKRYDKKESPVAKQARSTTLKAVREDKAEKEAVSLEEEKDFDEKYTEQERKDLEKLYAENLKPVKESEVIEGVLTHKTGSNAVVSIGHKSDGLVHLSEFRDMENMPKVGDKIDVYVEKQEDKEGNLVLSRKKALVLRSWDRISEAMEKEETLEGRVKRRTKGGLILDILGVEAFLPGSQIDVKPVRDFDNYVGKDIEVRVLKISYKSENVVVSHRALIEKDIEAQKSELLDNIEQGQVLEGIVKNITHFGAFVDLGGVDGLLHITDISWKRVHRVEDVLSTGDKINVVVLSFDKEKRRISLGIKQLEPHPWDQVQDLEPGAKVKGKVSNITDYGAFLELYEGVEGLIHVSEMSWSQHMKSPADLVELGQELEAVVLSMDKEKHKMALGLKQLSTDPWKDPKVMKKYGIGTRQKGIVRNMTNYGLFLELEKGIDGLVHVSDLSWTKRVRHPSDMFNIGEEMEVVVMEVDPDNRKLALSHKHTQEDPWNGLESFFAIDSVHRGVLLRSDEKVGIVELPYGLEGICLAKNLHKEDGTLPEPKETIDVMILRTQREERRIFVSHVHAYKKKQKEEEEDEKLPASDTEASAETVRKKSADRAATMGDLSALSELKKKMDSKTDKKVATKTPAPEEEKTQKPASKKK